MKRFKLSTQLVLLIILIVITASTLFIALTFSKMDAIAETTTLNNLTSVVSTNKEYWDNKENTDDFKLDDNSVMKIAYFRVFFEPRDNGGNYSPTALRTSNKKPDADFAPGREYYNISSNISAILGDNFNLDDIVKSTSMIPGASGTATMTYHARKIYISYATSSTNDLLFVTLTNSTYANNIKTKWTLDIAYIFFSIIILSFIIIYVWSKYYTNRLYKLNAHINSLDKNNYEGEYVDSGKDELANLTNSVEQMRIVLKESENVKREMLQNVSHDFKTPISVIRGYAEAIRDGVEDPKSADLIIAQSEILQAKVYKLLQYNRLEYLSKDKEFEEIHMKYIIENVIHNYRNIEGIILEDELDDSIFYGYEENYYTVVDNIMENAKRYAKSLIKITLKDGVLKIYNDGDHIDEKFVNGIFRAYEKGSKGQFGLGMSIVQKTLDFFNYEISVENKEVGCEFTINKKPNRNVEQL